MRGPTARSLRDHLAATAMLGACLVLPVLTACYRPQVGTASVADVRAPVRLSAKEREHLSVGMRVYLECTQGIVEALAEHKMSVVAEIARKAGMGAVHDVPLSVVAKLPPEFVLLAVDTHQKFDALSLAAAGNKREVLQHLRDILANCTACHALYRISPE